jgi:hypothetical protein
MSVAMKAEANPAAGVVIFTGSDEAPDVERVREVEAAALVQRSHVDAVLLASDPSRCRASAETARDPSGEHISKRRSHSLERRRPSARTCRRDASSR